jgi:hypothetical protein
MASSYDNDLRLNEMATGDASGTWGTTTNTNLELIAEAFSYGTEVITTNADTHTTTIADGATDPGRALYLKYTGTLDSACTITIAPNDISKVWIIENGTSGSQNIIISQGSGANITIPAGDTKVVYSDGAGSGAAFFDAFASLSVVDLKVQDDLTVTDAALVTGVLTTTATQVATGGITSGSDIISDTDSTDSLGSTGVRWLKGWFDTLTAGTLTVGSGSVTDSSGAISFGDENLTTTGIVTAAGTSVFTNLDISGDIDVDGTTNLDVVDIDGAVDMATTLAVAGNVDFNGDLDVDGTTNLDVVDIDGAVDMASTLTVAGDANFDSNTLFVDVSANNVGIGTASPATKLQVNFGDAGGNLVNLVGDGATAGTAIATNWNTGNAYFDIRLGGTTDTYTVMRVQNSGNVGIGTVTPGSFDAEANNLVVGSGSGDEGITIFTGSSVGDYGSIFFGDATGTPKQGQIRYEQNNEVMSFYTNASEKMRIDLNGRVGIGRTPSIANSKLEVGGADDVSLINVEASGATGGMGIGSTGLQIFHGSSIKMRILSNGRVQYAGIDTTASGALNILGEVGNSYDAIQFYHNSSTVVGRIRTAVSSTAYTTSSDYRLKENVDYTWDATTRLKQLKPARFNFIIDDTNTLVDGFLAHEVQEIVPEAITGSKDEVDSEGNPDYQGIDQSKLVPLLVKTIQELEARITTLENA